MVNIHKFQVYKTMSRSRVDESLEKDFIVILTKNQERGEGNKE